jgi:hypothetical protein
MAAIGLRNDFKGWVVMLGENYHVGCATLAPNYLNFYTNTWNKIPLTPIRKYSKRTSPDICSHIPSEKTNPVEQSNNICQ